MTAVFCWWHLEGVRGVCLIEIVGTMGQRKDINSSYTNSLWDATPRKSGGWQTAGQSINLEQKRRVLVNFLFFSFSFSFEN